MAIAHEIYDLDEAELYYVLEEIGDWSNHHQLSNLSNVIESEFEQIRSKSAKIAVRKSVNHLHERLELSQNRDIEEVIEIILKYQTLYQNYLELKDQEQSVDTKQFEKVQFKKWNEIYQGVAEQKARLILYTFLKLSTNHQHPVTQATLKGSNVVFDNGKYKKYESQITALFYDWEMRLLSESKIELNKEKADMREKQKNFTSKLFRKDGDGNFTLLLNSLLHLLNSIKTFNEFKSNIQLQLKQLLPMPTLSTLFLCKKNMHQYLKSVVEDGPEWSEQRSVKKSRDVVELSPKLLEQPPLPTKSRRKSTALDPITSSGIKNIDPDIRHEHIRSSEKKRSGHFDSAENTSSDFVIHHVHKARHQFDEIYNALDPLHTIYSVHEPAFRIGISEGMDETDKGKSQSSFQEVLRQAEDGSEYLKYDHVVSTTPLPKPDSNRKRKGAHREAEGPTLGRGKIKKLLTGTRSSSSLVEFDTQEAAVNENGDHQANEDLIDEDQGSVVDSDISPIVNQLKQTKKSVFKKNPKKLDSFERKKKQDDSGEMLSSDPSMTRQNQTQKKRRPWTYDEEVALKIAVNKHGVGNWAGIMYEDSSLPDEDRMFKNRSNVDLKDKYRNLLKKEARRSLNSPNGINDDSYDARDGDMQEGELDMGEAVDFSIPIDTSQSHNDDN